MSLFSFSVSESGNRIERGWEQPRLLPLHWSLLGRGSKGQLLMPEEVEKDDNDSNRDITDDGNYSRPTGTTRGSSVFVNRYNCRMETKSSNKNLEKLPRMVLS